MSEAGVEIRTAVEIRGTHPASFRSGQWARILTTVTSYGRECWLVEFPDGKTDWWPIDDPAAMYELR